MRKESITITIDSDVMIALEKKAKAEKCSKSFIVNELLRQALKTAKSPDYSDIFSRVANVARISTSMVNKYYNRVTTAENFWCSVLPTKSGAVVMKDLGGKLFAKFKKCEDYIPLPETGHLIKDIEEGTKNIEEVIRTIPEQKILINKEFKESFFNRLKEAEQ